MSKREIYEQNHFLAKVIMSAVLSILSSAAVLVSVYSIVGAAVIAGIIPPIWVFGVNFTGYLIEEYKGQPHTHRRI